MSLSRGPESSVVALVFLCSALTGCTKFDLLNATIPPCGCSRTSDLVYGPLPRQKLDVYRPNGAKPGARVVVFFYGGSWQSGAKGDYRFVAQALTSRGLIAVLPDYRLYPQATFPSFVEDGAASVRWVHDNIARFGGDPSHVYLMGHSAGAHIAALLTLDEHYLKAVGLSRRDIRAAAMLSGPYDFVPAPDDRPVFGMARTDTAPDPRIEPVHFVDGREPPILLIQGLKDTTVDPSNTSRLAARIRERGGSVRVIFYPKRGHAGVVLALAWPFRWLAPVLRDSAAFFQGN